MSDVWHDVQHLERDALRLAQSMFYHGVSFDAAANLLRKMYISVLYEKAQLLERESEKEAK